MSAKNFGQYIRDSRLKLQEANRDYSLRQMAKRLGVEPSYLSKIERQEESSVSEELIKKIAHELGEDENVLLAMCGKVSSQLKEIILKDPKVFCELLNSLKDAPPGAVLRIAREVKLGQW